MKGKFLSVGIVLLMVWFIIFTIAANTDLEPATGLLANALLVVSGVSGWGGIILVIYGGFASEEKEKKPTTSKSTPKSKREESMDKLEKLNALKKSGAITEEEFEKKKKEILEKI